VNVKKTDLENLHVFIAPEYEKAVFGISSLLPVCAPRWSLDGWADFIYIQYSKVLSS
jgi:hypothetical protein